MTQTPSNNHDREFWIQIRRALLIAVQAIEKKYNLAKPTNDK